MARGKAFIFSTCLIYLTNLKEKGIKVIEWSTTRTHLIYITEDKKEHQIKISEINLKEC